VIRPSSFVLMATGWDHERVARNCVINHAYFYLYLFTGRRVAVNRGGGVGGAKAKANRQAWAGPIRLSANAFTSLSSNYSFAYPVRHCSLSQLAVAVAAQCLATVLCHCYSGTSSGYWSNSRSHSHTRWTVCACHVAVIFPT
jgi:hypothetical protein